MHPRISLAFLATWAHCSLVVNLLSTRTCIFTETMFPESTRNLRKPPGFFTDPHLPQFFTWDVEKTLLLCHLCYWHLPKDTASAREEWSTERCPLVLGRDWLCECKKGLQYSPTRAFLMVESASVGIIASVKSTWKRACKNSEFVIFYCLLKGI